MSVTEVIEQLRRAHTLLTEARNATNQADKAITDGATIFATATTGSTQPEVPKIAALARQSTEDVRAADALFAQTQALIDAYCDHVAGHGPGTAPPASTQAPTTEPQAPGVRSVDPSHELDSSRYHDQAMIAELQRNGVKISPDKVIRITRHRDGRIVWLEAGDIDRSGQAHILRPSRREDFQDAGVPFDKVIDKIFHLIEKHQPIETDGRGGAIYEVETDSGTKGLKIVIGDNGYIVTSHPVHARRLKKRPRSHEG